MTRHSCGGEIVESVSVIGGYAIDAKRCTRCGEAQPDLMQSQLVLAHKRFESGDEPLTGTATTVGGGSYAVRFPIALFRAFNLRAGDEVPLRPTRPGFVEVRLHPQAERILPVAPVPRQPDPAPSQQEKLIIVRTTDAENTTARKVELTDRRIRMVLP